MHKQECTQLRARLCISLRPHCVLYWFPHRSYQEIPCWRADLRLLLDEEEIDVMLAHIARHKIEERTSARLNSRREKCAELFLREMRERGEKVRR